MDRVKRIWYLSPMRALKVQASLRIRAVSPEPSLLAHTSTESRGTFRQKTRSLAPLNGWACAVEICHDGMLEDTNSLDRVHVVITVPPVVKLCMFYKMSFITRKTCLRGVRPAQLQTLADLRLCCSHMAKTGFFLMWLK